MYEVKWCNEPESEIWTYNGTYLYLLLPDIFPHGPVDTMDVRFWKYSQAPLVSPLQNLMKLEMYNDMYFQPSKVSVNRCRKYEA